MYVHKGRTDSVHVEMDVQCVYVSKTASVHATNGQQHGHWAFKHRTTQVLLNNGKSIVVGDN